MANENQVEVTVEEHGIATGNLAPRRFEYFTRGRPQQRLVPSAAHAAASALHGWNDHAHHAGEPFRCTREAYEAALQAASHPVTRLAAGGDPLDAEQIAELNGTKPTVSTYEPHEAALSEHCPHAPSEA